MEFKSASHCRFCNSALPARQRGDVCGSPECAEKVSLHQRIFFLIIFGDEKMNLACKKKLACGHACPGVAGEPVCPPCRIACFWLLEMFFVNWTKRFARSMRCKRTRI